MTRSELVRDYLARHKSEHRATRKRGKIVFINPKQFLCGELPDYLKSIEPEDSTTIYVTTEEFEVLHNAAEEAPRLIDSSVFLAGELIHNKRRVLRPEENDKPPRSADFLAYMILPRTDRKIILGDLTEEYPSVVLRLGERGAQIYYCKQVLGSIWPLVRKAIIKWGAVGWVVELIRGISS